jgi:hypothetical protein
VEALWEGAAGSAQQREASRQSLHRIRGAGHADGGQRRIRRLPGIKSMNTMFVLREMTEFPTLPVG